MGRRNEANRLVHKKKVDDKNSRAQEAKALRKQKLKQIISQYNTETDA